MYILVSLYDIGQHFISSSIFVVFFDERDVNEERIFCSHIELLRLTGELLVIERPNLSVVNAVIGTRPHNLP